MLEVPMGRLDSAIEYWLNETGIQRQHVFKPDCSLSRAQPTPRDETFFAFV